MIDRIVLNIPHSSDRFPFGKDGWGKGIDQCVSRWTDWYTDILFSPKDEDVRVVPAVFPFSRFFCDVERLENDPLEGKGQGIVYLNFDGIQRTLSSEEAKAIKENFYDEHIRRLKSLLTPSSFLIDCHSFPSDLSDVEVCIGINDDWSRPDDGIVQWTENMFRKNGYVTEVNRPYSNSISPRAAFPYPSMMIELNKKTYMTPEGLLDTVKAEKSQNLIFSLYHKILNNCHQP